MRFEFASAARVMVGPGCSRELPGLAASIGRRALIIHGKSAYERDGPTALLLRQMDAAGLTSIAVPVEQEPHLALILMAGGLCRVHQCDMVIGIGGGSVLDTAKAAAALATNDGTPLDYMEIVGAGRPLERPALPVVAVPTTAGSGSEVTRNAVIAAPEAGVKVSIRHASMLPRLALVDSTLTHDLPPAVTASSGLDALTQLLEAYVSCRAQPITDGLCLEGLSRVGRALPIAYRSPHDGPAREAMSVASLLSGMALANAGLGLVHGAAGAVGGTYHVPHGAACAALLPGATSINLRALRERDPDGPGLRRYRRAARVLLDRESASPDDLVTFLQNLVEELSIPPLSHYGLLSRDIPGLAEAAGRANSTRGNPISLSRAEIEEAISLAM